MQTLVIVKKGSLQVWFQTKEEAIVFASSILSGKIAETSYEKVNWDYKDFVIDTENRKNYSIEIFSSIVYDSKEEFVEKNTKEIPEETAVEQEQI